MFLYSYFFIVNIFNLVFVHKNSILLPPEELQLYIADFGQIMYRVNRKNHIQNSKFKIQT
jgi:hypothetical protein